jgi:AcrR family transcriptional regulator
LEAPEGLANFSVDAIARQAGVARMTVYYQFGSKAGLLEALLDDLANQGGMDRLPGAFRRSDPLDALDAFIIVLGHFYSAYRLIDRRLRALAVLDRDLEPALAARDERRRTGLRVIAQRISTPPGDSALGEPVQDGRDHGPGLDLEETIAVLHMLTSFQSFDALASNTRSIDDVVPLVQRVARAILRHECVT